MHFIGMLILLWSFLSSSSFAQEGKEPLRLNLQGALLRANTVNLQIMMAEARVEGAIARLYQARSALLPQVDGLLSAGRQTTDLRATGLTLPGLSSQNGPYNSFNARPRLTIALFDLGSWARFRAARKGEDLSKTQLEKTREDVLALAANLYMEAERRLETVGFLYTMLQKDQMAYNISVTHFSQGTGTELEVNRFKFNLDQTRYLYQQAEAQALEARLDLAAVLGLPLDQPLVFVEDKNFWRNLKNMTGDNAGVVSNADVVLAASGLAQDLANQTAARADFLPKISGIADYGRMGQSPDHSSDTYFVGVAASVPIWEGGLQQAKLKEARAHVQEARENLQDAQNQAGIAIASARAMMIEADQLALASEDERITAEKSLGLAVHAQTIGSGSVFEVIKAKSDLAQTQDAYNEARATWVMAHINLLHAEGRLKELIHEK